MNFLLFVFATIACVFPLQSDTSLTKYSVKSGMIKYSYEGRSNLTEVIFFDDYGELFYDRKSTIINENNSMVTNSIVRVIRYDTLFLLDTKTNIVTQNFIVNTDEKIKHNIISKEMIMNLGYVYSGSETVSGIICAKYTGEYGTICMWNDIVIKSEMEIMDVKIKMEAIEVVTGIVIESSKFILTNNNL